MKLDGKVAIVTGAGKGITLALCLAREGADVAVNAFQGERQSGFRADQGAGAPISCRKLT